MDCEHERLRTVGDRVFCCTCGEELPLDFLMAKSAPKEEKPAERKTTQRKARKGEE